MSSPESASVVCHQANVSGSWISASRAAWAIDAHESESRIQMSVFMTASIRLKLRAKVADCARFLEAQGDIQHRRLRQPGRDDLYADRQTVVAGSETQG